MVRHRSIKNKLTEPVARYLKPFNDFMWKTYTLSRRDFGPVNAGYEMYSVDFCQCKYNDFLTLAYRFVYQARAAAESIRAIPAAAQQNQVDLTNTQLMNAVRERYLQGNDRPRVRELLVRYGLSPLVIDGIDNRLAEAQGEWRSLIPGLDANTVLDVLNKLPSLLEEHAERVERYIQSGLLDIDDDEEAREALAKISLISNPEVKFDCNWIEDEDARGFCYVIVVIIAIVLLLILVVMWIAEWIDWIQRDDRVRAEVNRRSCPEISGVSDDTLVGWIREMLDGPTLDDDENTILRILECVEGDCSRMRSLVDRLGRPNLVNDFHGEEWDRLMILLQRCGIVDFRSWDDDATRQFINGSSCATINSLSLAEIRQLMINLFEGDTGDADERAIIRVMSCLPCVRRRELMTIPGVRYSNFDSEVHGSEWTRLRRLLQC